MGGVMLIAYASIVPITSLTSWALGAFARLAIVGGWALVAGMFVAAFTGKRGLKFGVSGVGSLVYISYIAGGILSLAANGFLIVGLAGSLA